MYILLCGYPPFNGETDKEIMAKVKTGRFKFYHEDWSNVSHEAKDLICKMLTFDQEQRITADEAMKHEWFTKKKSGAVIDSKIMAKLSSFHVLPLKFANLRKE